MAEEKEKRIAKLNYVRNCELRRIEIARRHALSLLRIREESLLFQADSSVKRSMADQQTEENKAKVKAVREKLFGKKGTKVDSLLLERKREIAAIKIMHKEMVSSSKKREAEAIAERRRAISELKSREKLVPLRLKYMLSKRNEMLNAAIEREVVMQEEHVREKEKMFESLAGVEHTLVRQYKQLRMMRKLLPVSEEYLQYSTINEKDGVPDGRFYAKYVKRPSVSFI